MSSAASRRQHGRRPRPARRSLLGKRHRGKPTRHQGRQGQPHAARPSGLRNLHTDTKQPHEPDREGSQPRFGRRARRPALRGVSERARCEPRMAQHPVVSNRHGAGPADPASLPHTLLGKTGVEDETGKTPSSSAARRFITASPWILPGAARDAALNRVTTQRWL